MSRASPAPRGNSQAALSPGANSRQAAGKPAARTQTTLPPSNPVAKWKRPLRVAMGSCCKASSGDSGRRRNSFAANSSTGLPPAVTLPATGRAGPSAKGARRAPGEAVSSQALVPWHSTRKA